MSKRIIIIFVALALVLGGVIFWYSSRQTASPDLGKLTMGWNRWVGTLPFFVAKDKGFFKELGLDIQFKEGDYSQMVGGLKAGQIDFSGSVALIDLMRNSGQGANIQVVGIADMSNGADAIVAKKGIKSIEALRGKKVAVEKGTLGEYMLLYALQRKNLSLDDVVETDSSAEDAAKAFLAGSVDAAVTYEPYLSQTVADNRGHIIFSTADVPGLIIDTIAFNRGIIEQNPEKIKAVLRAYLKAVDFIQKNPDESYAIGAKYFKISPEEFARQSKGIKIAGLRENSAAFSHGGGYVSLYSAGESRNAFLKTIGNTYNEVNVNDILAPQFIRDLNIQ